MPITFNASREVPEDAEVLAVPVFKGGVLPAGSPAELDSRFLDGSGFEGKVGETRPLMADDGSVILAVGVGPAEGVDEDVLRRASAASVKASTKATHIATALLDAVPAGGDRARAAQALVEGAALAAYRFSQFKSEAKPSSLERVTVVGRGASLQNALDRGARIAEAVSFARDLVNMPAGQKPPRYLGEVAEEIGQREGLTVEVWDKERILAEGLGGLGGVAMGSAEEPRLIKMTYEPSGGAARGTVALVGKGITFDSGGLSIKTGEGMMTMKGDMAGAAAVIATMSLLPTLRPKVRVIGYAACTENMPSGTAMRPGDVLTARNGKTIEVLNTDAEGRLVLADALSLAVEDGADAIVDLATLTGACVVALGREVAGLMGNDDELIEQVEAASERAGEPMWHLPLPERYRKHIDSEVADIKNIGATGQAGTLAAGLFLQEFVDGKPWVHLDIAGPAFTQEGGDYLSKGGTGFGVRTLVELLTTFRRSGRKR
jgi:leucyl aminopeptidase